MLKVCTETSGLQPGSLIAPSVLTTGDATTPSSSQATELAPDVQRISTRVEIIDISLSGEDLTAVIFDRRQILAQLSSKNHLA